MINGTESTSTSIGADAVVAVRTGGQWSLSDIDLTSVVGAIDDDDVAAGWNGTLLSAVGESSINSSSYRPGGTDTLHALRSLRYVVLVLYLLTFVFGLVGNSLTIFVILRNKRMKTVATCFILNLAVADDLFMLSLPFMAHNTFAHRWLFGSVMCKLMSALYGINLFASIFTMVLMSVDRYLAIVYPLRSIRYRTCKNAVLVCVTIWLICFVLMMPYWMYARTDTSASGHQTCKLYWPQQSQLEHMWFWTNFQGVIGFVLPTLVMTVCYLQLLRHLVSESSSSPVNEQAKRPIRKVTAMVFVVSIVFIVCWTPYHIVRYTNAVKMKNYMMYRRLPTQAQVVNFAIFNTVAQGLVFMSSCCNPFIYAISSHNFSE